MKFLVLLLFLIATALTSASTSTNFRPTHRELKEECGKCEKTLFPDETCGGFNVKVNKYFDDYAQQPKDGGNATENENCESTCCADDPSVCCVPYPAGYWVAFAIGVGGLGFMFLICLFKIPKNCCQRENKEV